MAGSPKADIGIGSEENGCGERQDGKPEYYGKRQGTFIERMKKETGRLRER